MASGGSDISSDEIYNFKCSPCLDDNRKREAAKYCVECQGYFCQPCAEMFHKLPGLKAHKFLDQTNYKSSSVVGRLPAIPTQTCSVHETKIVDMYCGNHDEVACTSCMTLNHRSCSDVKSIPDIVDNALKMPDIKRMNQKLRDLKMLKEKVVDTKRAQREDLKKSKLDAITEIRKYRKDLDAVLDNIEKESIDEVLEIFQKVDQEFCHDKTKAENEIDLLERSLNDLKQSEGNNAQLFVSLKLAASNISKMDDDKIPEQTSYETKITYRFNPTIQTTLQNLKTFGSALQPITATTVWSVECIKDFDISLQSDTATCGVYGTCLTTDGFLLVSDSTNKKLKRADIQNIRVKDYCSLPASPYGVCCTSDTEAAICLKERSVQFVLLNRQLTLTRNMKLNHECFGIAYKDQKLYITDNHTSIYIHDLTGNVLQIVYQDNKGGNIFQHPRSIAFSDVDDKILVASWVKGLVFLDGKGNYCKTLNEPGLSIVSGVCTDDSGALFVSGYSSNNVIQIGSDGKKMGVIIKSSDGLQRPESVCFDKRKRMLLISGYNNNIVKVVFLK